MFTRLTTRIKKNLIVISFVSVLAILVFLLMPSSNQPERITQFCGIVMETGRHDGMHELITEAKLGKPFLVKPGFEVEVEAIVQKQIPGVGTYQTRYYRRAAQPNQLEELHVLWYQSKLFGWECVDSVIFSDYRRR